MLTLELVVATTSAEVVWREARGLNKIDVFQEID